jgi:hypothetical protein
MASPAWPFASAADGPPPIGGASTGNATGNSPGSKQGARDLGVQGVYMNPLGLFPTAFQRLARKILSALLLHCWIPGLLAADPLSGL